MNETVTTIINRRSIRSFKPEQIRDSELNEIIETARYAPSAMNQQPWHFTVIQSKTLIDTLNRDAKEAGKNSGIELFVKRANDPAEHVFYNAPTLILVSGERKARSPVTDCAAAAENILLAAESLGIGSCWILGFTEQLFKGAKGKEYVTMLKIPDGFDPYYMIALGYKADQANTPPPRREGTVQYIK